MTDIRTDFVSFDQGADYALDTLGLVEDDGLETAVIISLFTDRQAGTDDDIPDGSGDRRGWWADTLSAGDQTGSRLWLLSREKQTQAVLNNAREYALEALQWLVDDGVAGQIEVEAEIVRDGILGLSIAIYRPAATSPIRYRYETLWRSV